jgi:hypothetical protein
MNSSLLPAIPILGSEVALELRPLPHPLAVQSSLLTSVAYDRDRAILQLEFGDGSVYQYFGVPVKGYQELLRAASQGVYFNRHIRSLFRYVLLPLPKKRPPLSVLPNTTPD